MLLSYCRRRGVLAAVRDRDIRMDPAIDYITGCLRQTMSHWQRDQVVSVQRTSNLQHSLAYPKPNLAPKPHLPHVLTSSDSDLIVLNPNMLKHHMQCGYSTSAGGVVDSEKAYYSSSRYVLLVLLRARILAK